MIKPGSPEFEEFAQHPSFHLEEASLRLGLGLNLPPDVFLTKDMSGRPALFLGPSAHYPRIDDIEDESVLKQLLLMPEDPETPSLLPIPDNSTTLVTIFNEAAGSVEDMGNERSTDQDVSRRGNRALGAIFEQLFEQFATELHIVGSIERQLPRALTYDQILVKKDDMSCKILPPLTIERVENNRQLAVQWRRLGAGLVRSLQEGAETPAQRQLAAILESQITKVFQRKQ